MTSVHGKPWKTLIRNFRRNSRIIPVEILYEFVWKSLGDILGETPKGIAENNSSETTGETLGPCVPWNFRRHWSEHKNHGKISQSNSGQNSWNHGRMPNLDLRVVLKTFAGSLWFHVEVAYSSGWLFGKQAEFRNIWIFLLDEQQESSQIKETFPASLLFREEAANFSWTRMNLGV